MTYPQWWERLVAGIIDGVIFAVIYYVLRLILAEGIGLSMGLGMFQLFGVISVILYVVAVVAYKVILEGGPKQATLGKMVFGIQVVDSAGGKASQRALFIRTWPWWTGLIMIIPYITLSVSLTSILSLISAAVIIVVYVFFFLDPKGRCLHDQTADLHVIKGAKGMVGGA